jgi:hypothetical protein
MVRMVSFKNTSWFSKNYYLRWNVCLRNRFPEGLQLKGRAWSIDEERLLRRLVEEGKGANKISEVMGKTRISVRAKM